MNLVKNTKSIFKDKDAFNCKGFEEYWQLHDVEELLNDNMTKFLYSSNEETGSVTIKLKKPCEIYAIGFKSANNFPHLDPKHIVVNVTIDEELDENEF